MDQKVKPESIQGKAIASGGIAAAVLLYVCLTFYNPTLFFMPGSPSYMAFFPQGVIGLLAVAMTLLAAKKLIQTVRAMKYSALAALLVFFILVLIQNVLHPEYRLVHWGQCIVWIAVPFCVFVFHDAFRKTLPPFLAIFTLWEILFFLLSKRHQGITGNINFTAALWILTFPFLLLYLFRFLKEKQLSRMRMALILIPALIAGLLLLARCDSRGAMLGLICTSALFLFLHLSDRSRRIMLYILLAGAILGTVLFLRFGVQPLSRMIANEDRPHIYAGTVNMIADHPFLGVGGASFETAFVKYKPLDYFLARHVADRTDHPHNQELFMLSSYGVFGYLAWLFLLYVPVFVLIRRLWLRQPMAPELKITLFVFLCVLIHAQFDLVFFFHPNYLMMLMMLGLFWSEVFLREKKAVDLPTRFLPICRAAGAAMFCLAAVCAARSICSSWMTWHLMSFPISRAERLEGIDKILDLAPDEYKQNYALMNLALKLNAPELALKASDVMLRSNIPDYGHLHALRGTVLVRLGRLPEAYETFRREAENYPLTVLPLLRMIHLAKKMDRQELFARLMQELDERMKARDINPKMLQAIQEKPHYDMRPWNIPVEKGGPGGRVIFADGSESFW